MATQLGLKNLPLNLNNATEWNALPKGRKAPKPAIDMVTFSKQFLGMPIAVFIKNQ